MLKLISLSLYNTTRARCIITESEFLSLIIIRLQEEEKLDASLFKNELVLYNEYDKMEKGIADRDVYIIMLQMKLLAEKEESEKLKMKVEELEHKNEKMARELRRVSQNYNQER